MADEGRYKLSDVQPQPGAPRKGQYSLMDVNPYPTGVRPAELPQLTNDDLKRWGRTALDYLPAVTATIGAIAAPELLPAYPFLAAVGGAGVAGGTGELIRQGALGVTGAECAPSGIGQAAWETLKTGGEQAAAEAGGRLVAKPFEWAFGKVFNPQRLYQGALKPSALAGPEEQALVVSAGLEGVPGPVPAGPLRVGEEAYHANRARIAEVNQRIMDVVTNRPPQAPYLVDPQDVAKRLDTLAQSSFGKQALNVEDLKTIAKAKQQYLEKHGARFNNKGVMTRPPTQMTGQSAQIEKMATYRELEGKYGAHQRAQEESEKSIASGLRESLAQLYPELQDLNPQDAAMIRLDGALRSHVAREGNKNLIPMFKAGVLTLGGLVGAVSGGAEGGIAGGLLGASILALDNPAVKSALAIALRSRAAKIAGKAAVASLPVAGLIGLGAARSQTPNGNGY